GCDNDTYRQIELPRELEIALVVCGDGHHRSRAVLAEHEVCDPDRDRLTGERIHCGTSCVEALLLVVATGARRTILEPEFLRLPLEAGGIAGAFSKTCDERMLRAEQHERRTEDRVDARGKYFDRLRAPGSGLRNRTRVLGSWSLESG